VRHIRRYSDDFQAARRNVVDNRLRHVMGSDWPDISRRRRRREEDDRRGKQRSQAHWTLSPFPG
jgi:hypothetical protein